MLARVMARGADTGKVAGNTCRVTVIDFPLLFAEGDARAAIKFMFPGEPGDLHLTATFDSNQYSVMGIFAERHARAAVQEHASWGAERPAPGALHAHAASTIIDFKQQSIIFLIAEGDARTAVQEHVPRRAGRPAPGAVHARAAAPHGHRRLLHRCPPESGRPAR